MRDAVIVDLIRTPIGRRNGSLKDIHPNDLAAFVLKEIVKRNGVEPSAVDDVIMGCVTQTDEQGLNIARVAALAAGFPDTVPGTSVNRMCASGLQACNFASMEVVAGNADIVIGGGVESMTRVPIGSDGGTISNFVTEKYDLVPQGVSAEIIADKWGLTRQELDQYALESHQRAVRAIDEGRFKREIMPVEVPDGNGRRRMFDTDEHPRRDTSLEKLSRLQPAFRPDGRITAGNSSGINDGAAAVLFMERSKARQLGLEPRARIVATAQAGVDPVIMLTGPIPATRRALAKAGLKMDDIDLIEMNEAFASIPLACGRELGIDFEKMNVNGGAIALGHPLGCSGARLLTTLVHEMERRDLRYGLATLCIGFGQGVTTIIERPD